VPTRIVATSGTKEGEKAATWVLDASKDPAFLAKAPAIEVTFSGEGLKW